MAGHSKWANIKHRKEKADAKKGKVFTRAAKEIISAVKMGGSDPKSNPRLRLALQKAKEGNVPNEVVERNIKKGLSQDTSHYEEVVYELYGHGGIGILVEVMTDNRNRISSEMRIATNKRGGVIATPGAVSFNFERKGVLEIKQEGNLEETLFQVAIEAGAEDFEVAEESFFITTSPHDLDKVRENIEEKSFKIEAASLTYLPKVTVQCSEDSKKSNLALLEWIESIDDVDEIYHNMEET